jgi:hypothetical protein
VSINNLLVKKTIKIMSYGSKTARIGEEKEGVILGCNFLGPVRVVQSIA